MPYMAVGKCVYKKNPDGSRGKKVGCTKGSVKRYLGALYMNVPDARSKKKPKKKPIAGTPEGYEAGLWGQKIRSGGRGRGLGKGRGNGPIGNPLDEEFAKRKKSTTSKALLRKTPQDDYKRKVDRRMKDYGEIDYKKKQIRINPSKTGKGGVLDTIVHEEMHRTQPKLTEKQVRKKTKKKLKKMSINSMIGKLKKYTKEKSMAKKKKSKKAKKAKKSKKKKKK